MPDEIQTPQPGTANPEYQNLYTAPAPIPTSQPVAFDAESFKTELLGAVKELIQTSRPEPVAPAVASSPDPEDWLKLMNEGKRDLAEAALARKMYELGSKGAVSNAQTAAVNEALARFTAFQEVKSYTDAMRSDPVNASILEMEPYITAIVERQIAARGDQIRTPQDYVKVYKETVKAEMEKARNFALGLRGQGAQGATVRQATVLASPHLAPNAVDTQREQQSQTQAEPQAETASDYLAKRNAVSARNRGLTV